MKPLIESELFQENPVFEELLNQFISKRAEQCHVSQDWRSRQRDSSLEQEQQQVANFPEAHLIPINAGISLPGIDVFTEENRSWYGIFSMDSTLKTSGFPAELMYPPGTRIDTALVSWEVSCEDREEFFATSSSALFLKRDSPDSSSLPLLQIKQNWYDTFRECEPSCHTFSSAKIAFANPTKWFQSLETFTYAIIKVTVPDTRSYAERTRVKLQSALDKIEGTALDKALFLQKELKVSYSLRLKRSVRDDYYEACVKLRECKRDVYAFAQIMDLDNPEHVYAFAQQGDIMKSLQMRVDTKKWILDRTPEAEKCMARPVNLRNGRICLFYEEPTVGILCPMLASLPDKKIYYKPPTYPNLQTIETQLKEVHARIRGGATIRLNL